MKTVRIATLKDELSLHIRAVERGASYLVTDRSRPVAQLIPIPAPEEETCDIIPAERPFSTAKKRIFRATRKKLNSLALLRTERGER
jgi:prevent-host-death family protein